MYITEDAMKKPITALTAVFIILFLFTFTAEAVKYPSFTYVLTEPYVITSLIPNPTPGQAEEAEQKVVAITQSGFESYIYDYPIDAMWIDLASTTMSMKAKGEYDGEKYTFTWDAVDVTLGVEEAFTDPAGMIAAVKKAIDDFRPSGTTMYEVVKSIHDYICGINEYSSGGKNAYNAFGSLMEGKSVCEGYAEAFKGLCDANGIPCVIVIGNAVKKTSTEGHMWNAVKMDDGKWYAVDVTWDDGESITDNYLLVGSGTAIGGTEFGKSHVEESDVTGLGYSFLEYPKIEKTAYRDSGKPFIKGSAEHGWFYGHLDANGKKFYGDLKNVPIPEGSEKYVTSERPTLPPETTAPPETTKPAETTEPPVTTKAPETTKLPPVGTTKAPDTTAPGTTVPGTAIPDTTAPDTTEAPVTAPPESGSDVTEEDTAEITSAEATSRDEDVTTVPTDTSDKDGNDSETTNAPAEEKNAGTVIAIIAAIAVILAVIAVILVKAGKKK